MKHAIVYLFMCFCLKSSAQNTTFGSIENVINHQISKLESLSGTYDKIFVVINLPDSVSSGNGIVVVKNKIDARTIRKKDRSFAIYLTVFTSYDQLNVQAVNFRVEKESNKMLHLINVNQGEVYVIKQK